MKDQIVCLLSFMPCKFACDFYIHKLMTLLSHFSSSQLVCLTFCLLTLWVFKIMLYFFMYKISVLFSASLLYHQVTSEIRSFMNQGSDRYEF